MGAVAYHVPVWIQGARENALVDSGASVTMMSLEMFQTLGNIEMTETNSGVRVVEGIVDGSVLKVVGTVWVPIQIGDFVSEPHTILVVSGTKQKFILGLDFLDRFQVSIDTTNRALRMGSGTNKPVLIDVWPAFHAEAIINRVTSTNLITLPPRTSTSVEVSVGRGTSGSGKSVLRRWMGIKKSWCHVPCISYVKEKLALIV